MERRLFGDEQLEKVFDSALRVLAEMGMKVENRQCLEAMGRLGAEIDYPRERALLSREVINRMLQMVRTEPAPRPRGFAPLPPAYGAGAAGTCPFYHDDENGERRRATEQDCIQAFRIMETCGVAEGGPLVSNGDCPPKFEAIRCLQLGMENLNRTVLRGTDLFHPEQVPFVAELGRLYRNDPAWFLPAGNCPTSPLTIGKTIADLAVAKAPYRKVYGVATMPVAGANAPMTPAGTAVIGVAEILGSYVLAKALNPKTCVRSSALSAMMDMRTGSVTFVAPEVFLADLLIVEVLERRLDLPCRVYGTYVDAKLPGMRAVFEKLMRCLGLGVYANLSPLDGVLDQGRLFSPTQMILDCDMHEFLTRSGAGAEVDDDTLAVEAILEVARDGTGYMTHEHTIRHMREAWNSLIYRRAHWVSMEDELAREREHLSRARAVWQDNLAKYEPPDHSKEFLQELHTICARAKKTLAGR